MGGISSHAAFLILSSDFLTQRRLPGPDVHPDLVSGRHRKPGMQSPLISDSVREQVLPVHSVSLDRPEGHPILVRLITIQYLAPPLIPRRIKDREVRPTPRGVVGDVDVGEEGGYPVSASVSSGERRVREPVGMEAVLLSNAVLDEL